MPSNQAAVYPSNKSPSLNVVSTPYPSGPEPDELIVQVRAIGINPIDWKLQDLGTDLFPWLKYPFIGGGDIAGTIISVGSNITHFKPGDRVTGYSASPGDRFAAYQKYAVLKQPVTVPLPDTINFEDGAVVPLVFATAAAALFGDIGLDGSGLSNKTQDQNQNSKKILLVAGGASGVGSAAIQLAVACGYTVFATSSPHNFEHCKSLGASRVFDYRAPDVASDLKAAFAESGDMTCVGTLAVSEDAFNLACDVLSSLSDQAHKNGDRDNSKIKIATVLPPPSTSIPTGIGPIFVQARRGVGSAELSKTLYEKFLPDGLATGMYKCVPGPLVVGTGLESVQAALERGKRGGVSCTKLVVSLEDE
ncbi:GroES-like protein [Xylariaceae sp. FL0255]|nr:GroES-like protein [Xylariaceae sp. FL0255]